MIDFTNEQLERYSRHILLQDVGVEGQIKLCEAKVLIIGAGGLGAPVALYLAAAGIGTLGILDHDRVEISNLQRQVVQSRPHGQDLSGNAVRRQCPGYHPRLRFYC